MTEEASKNVPEMELQRFCSVKMQTRCLGYSLNEQYEFKK